MSLLLQEREYVIVFNDFLNESELTRLHDYASQLPLAKGVVGNGGDFVFNSNFRDSMVKWINYNKDVKWLSDKLLILINQLNAKYFHMDLGSIEPLQYTTYPAMGGYYNSHMDTFINSYPQRKISFSIQLSDEKDYEGGDLLIYEQTIKNPFKAPRNKGTIVVFFSMLMHEVTPVTEGTRQSLVGWVSGPPLK